jgi:hypothetical protein
MMEGTAGDRWEEFYRTCRLVIENERRFSEKDVNFADSMEERFDRFKADTYVSTSQINWLNDLEQRVRDHGL